MSRPINPETAPRNERLLNMWAAGWPDSAISAAVGVSAVAVRVIACRARAAGDARATLRCVASPKTSLREKNAPRNEAVLNTWAAGKTTRIIARRLSIPESTVNSIIRDARLACDPRAAWRNLACAAKHQGNPT